MLDFFLFGLYFIVGTPPIPREHELHKNGDAKKGWFVMSERDSVYPVKGIKYIKSLYKSSVPEPLIQGSFNVFGLG